MTTEATSLQGISSSYERTSYPQAISQQNLLTDVRYVAVVEDETMAGLPVLLAFIAAALLLATVWTRRFRRGPLEYALHAATRPARHVR